MGYVLEKHWKKYCYCQEKLIYEINIYNRKIEKSTYSLELMKRSWNYLSKSTIIPWSLELIITFKDFWNWELLLGNSSISWDIRTLDKVYQYADKYFTERFDEDGDLIKAWDGLVGNENISLDILGYLIEKNIYINREALALNSRFFNFLDVFECLSNELNIYNYLYYLSGNRNIKWTTEILLEFKDELNWSSTFSRWENHKYLSHSLSNLENYYYTADFIEKVQDKIDFRQLSGCKNVEWTPQLIYRYFDKWDWSKLMTNDILANNEEFQLLVEMRKKK